MFVGIDYHKRYLVATKMDASGKQQWQERVPTENLYRDSLRGYR